MNTDINLKQANVPNKSQGDDRANRDSIPEFIHPKVADDFSNQRIVTWINEFHKSLSDKFEVGIKLDHLGKKVSFYVDHIGHSNASLISFRGHQENGEKVQFVKHLSQVSIELLSLNRRTVDQPKTPIGFTSWLEYEDEKYTA